MTMFNSYVKLPEGISQCMEKTQAAGLPQMPQMPRPPGLHLPVATHSNYSSVIIHNVWFHGNPGNIPIYPNVQLFRGPNSALCIQSGIPLDFKILQVCLHIQYVGGGCGLSRSISHHLGCAFKRAQMILKKLKNIDHGSLSAGKPRIAIA